MTLQPECERNSEWPTSTPDQAQNRPDRILSGTEQEQNTWMISFCKKGNVRVTGFVLFIRDKGSQGDKCVTLIRGSSNLGVGHHRVLPWRPRQYVCFFRKWSRWGLLFLVLVHSQPLSLPWSLMPLTSNQSRSHRQAGSARPHSLTTIPRNSEGLSNLSQYFFPTLSSPLTCLSPTYLGSLSLLMFSLSSAWRNAGSIRFLRQVF